MRRSSRRNRQLRRSKTSLFRQFPEGVRPGDRQKAADQRIQYHENCFDGGVQITQCVVRGVQAEVNAERKNQLDEASSRFAELQDRGPQNVGQHQSHEIKILGSLKNKVKENLAAGLHGGEGLLHDGEGEQRRTSQKNDRAHLNIALSVQLTEYVRIQAA